MVCILRKSEARVTCKMHALASFLVVADICAMRSFGGRCFEVSRLGNLETFVALLRLRHRVDLDSWAVSVVRAGRMVALPPDCSDLRSSTGRLPRRQPEKGGGEAAGTHPKCHRPDLCNC